MNIEICYLLENKQNEAQSTGATLFALLFILRMSEGKSLFRSKFHLHQQKDHHILYFHMNDQ